VTYSSNCNTVQCSTSYVLKHYPRLYSLTTDGEFSKQSIVNVLWSQ